MTVAEKPERQLRQTCSILLNPLERFTERCKATGVRWAIFSDLYGVWFPEVRHKWYEKDPDTVREVEFSALLRDFDDALGIYSEIYFYHNPRRFPSALRPSPEPERVEKPCQTESRTCRRSCEHEYCPLRLVT